VESWTKEKGNRGELRVFAEYRNASAATSGSARFEIPAAGGNDRQIAIGETVSKRKRQADVQNAGL
jgi:hypothetical protein